MMSMNSPGKLLVPGDFCSVSTFYNHSFRYRSPRDVAEEVERIGNSRVVREPVGVVAAITAWNYPLLLLFGKVAPAMAAANIARRVSSMRSAFASGVSSAPAGSPRERGIA